MTQHLKAAVLSVSLAILLLPAVLAAQQTKQAPPAPIPPQILAARRVFVANGGLDTAWYEDPLLTGSADRSYNQFYAAMKAIGRYELVGAPADSDLLFEIQMVVSPLAGAAAVSLARHPYDPHFRLTIRDPKTNALLWTIIEHARWAVLQGNRDKNVDLAMTKLIGDVQVLSGGAATPAEETKP